MSQELEKLLLDEKPTLVIWQTGTFDALRGVDPEDFRSSVAGGVETLQNGGADVILMNMQYSPRIESMIAVGIYADNMRWVAREREVPLFDRLAIMRQWNDTGAIDLYARDQGCRPRQACARLRRPCAGVPDHRRREPRGAGKQVFTMTTASGFRFATSLGFAALAATMTLVPAAVAPVRAETPKKTAALNHPSAPGHHRRAVE